MKNGRHEESVGVFWYRNNLPHREDGPAIEWANGKKSWLLNGQYLTEDEFNHWRMKQDLNEKLHTTLAHKPIIKGGKI